MKGGENIAVKNDISFNIQVARSIDAKDLKSLGANPPCRFESGPGYHFARCTSYEVQIPLN